MSAGFSSVIPCRSDGYTRVNQMAVPPTVQPSFRPSQTPTTRQPSFPPSPAPSATPVSPTVEATYAPTDIPTNFPSQTMKPSNRPSVRSSAYFNQSLANHSQAVIRLSSFLVVRNVQIKSGQSLDTKSETALCHAVSSILDIASGSHQLISFHF